MTSLTLRQGRSKSKAVAVCFSSIKQLFEVMPELEHIPLLNSIFPGPVTICVPRPKSLPEHINPEFDYLGIRIPDNNLTRKLCAENALCLTSANRSGQSSAITANDFAELHPDLDLVIDMGQIKNSESRSVKTLTAKNNCL